MKIQTITVRYGRTHNLGDYSNVRPEVELTAELDDSDTPELALAALRDLAREAVHDEIDEALEQIDKPAVFSSERRYSIWEVVNGRHTRMGYGAPPEELIIIAPEGVNLKPNEAGRNWATKTRYVGHRADAALTIARRLAHDAGGVRLINIVDDILPPWVLAPIPEPTPAAEPALPFEDSGDEEDAGDETPF